MALSRTARILIAVLLVAAAAFFWVNFFNQDLSATEPASADASSGAGVPAPAAGVMANGSGGVATTPADAVPADGAAPAADAADATPADATPAGAVGAEATPAGDAVAQPAGADDGAVSIDPPIVVTESPTVVTRDLVVDDLPFLVTQPPQLGTEATAEDAAAGATRPLGAVRSSVNPFSPIVVQAPAAAAAPTAAASPAPQPVITEVTASGAQPTTAQASAASPASSTPAAVAEPVRAPAPRTTAPAPTAASALPRPLPSGTLPVTPEILRDARTEPSTPAGPADLGEVVAVREPGSQDGAALPTVAGSTPTSGAEAPDVLGTNRPATASVNGGDQAPLVAGSNELSRYLRDNDVRFTGTVLGPLSVGVFRSNVYGQPVVLTLGQTLPETEILLADLRGYEAKFSLGDSTQTLSLDLRR
jgi:hypothetical protein